MSRERVWLYSRVAIGGNSAGLLEAQERSMKQYAREHELEVVGCSSDVGNSLTIDRPGLLNFRAAVMEKQVDVLLTQNISRLGRDVEQVIRYWKFLQDHGVRVFTVTDGEIYLGMESLIFDMFSDMAQVKSNI